MDRASAAGAVVEAGLTFNWAAASVEPPPPKVVLTMRVNRDVLDYFRRNGRGYQSAINAVLRSYVDHMLHHDRR